MRVLLGLLVLFSASVPAREGSAQPTGHWEKQLIDDQGVETWLVFSDALHGVLLTQGLKSETYTTQDGGVSWTQGERALGSREDVHEVSSRNEGEFLISPHNYTNDNGVHWTAPAQNPFEISRSWATLLPVGGTTMVGQFPYTFNSQGDSLGIYSLNEAGGYYERIFAHYYPKRTLLDVVFAPNNHIFALMDSVSGTSYALFLASSDGGATFSEFRFGPELQFRFRSQIATSNNNDIYIVGGDSPSIHDVLCSTDGGLSWNLRSGLDVTDTTKGSRVVLLSSPSENRLWAAVTNATPLPRAALRAIKLSNFPIDRFSDSLFFSSDKGVTWQKDGKTFKDDTIVDMYWPDSTHGYVATYKNGATYVYRWVEETSSVASAAGEPNEPSVLVHDWLELRESERGAEFVISDILGRTVLRAVGTEQVNVSKLPPGFYNLAVEAKSGYRAFLKQ